MAITISDDNMALIKSVLAWPEAENLLLDDELIKTICIKPALTRYFTKFPIQEEVQVAIVEEAIIPFPDEYTYGVLDARVVDTGLAIGTGTSFWDIVTYQNMGGASRTTAGAWGIKGYNPSNIVQQRDIQRQAMKSYQNQYATIKCHVQEELRRVVMYSSIQGKANIIWAKWSDNFETGVKYARKMDVIDLARANLLYHLADTTSILQDSALETTINSEALKTRAGELETKVFELWNSFQDIVMIHSV